MDERSARLALPLLVPGQAQKEMTHNEALAQLELLVGASVVARTNAPPPAPQPGACWIVGENPTGPWSGKSGAIAGWTPSGWRFAAPPEGMLVWVAAEDGYARYADGIWRMRQPLGAPVPLDAPPSGGAVVDIEARAAIAAVRAALARHGLVGA